MLIINKLHTNKSVQTLILILIISMLNVEISKSNQIHKVQNLASIKSEIIRIEKSRVLHLADSLLAEKPTTVTAAFCPRSAGGIHDYYSEGTYWWPDPANPDGPYIRKDGVNNPDNFDFHLKAIGRFSWITGTETSAFLLTGNKKYALAAVKHLKAWFIDSATVMNPNLLYAQAIKGINSGRGIGIIDAVSLIEVARSVEILEKTPYLSETDAKTIKNWFGKFIDWLNTHPYGIDEMNAKNNHGTWWHAQVAAYAYLTGNREMMEKCRKHYREILLPNQMSQDGSFPLELERTKPFAYSLFNLDGMAALAVLVSDKKFDGWHFKLADGRGMETGTAFIKPFLVNINNWTYPKDISRWDEQPGRRPFMYLAALHQNSTEWLEIWKKNNADFPSDESRRNMPLKNSVLWLDINTPVLQNPKEKWLKNALETSEYQLLSASKAWKDSLKTPRTFENGKILLVNEKDWTCGFFPGSLWYMYEITGNEDFRTEAERFTGFLSKVQYRTNTHDVGFMLQCSYGNGFRITGNEAYKQVLMTGATNLLNRFHPETGLIKSWDGRKNWQYPVIIDNMMNLELLYETGKLTDNKKMLAATVSHADKTIENHFRPDFSCYHVVNYDSISGKVISKVTHQGYSDASSWARGQAWALYGYTMMYRETKKVEYLKQAENIAQYILHHTNLPKDKIPYWDFDAPDIPNEPRDASAAAIIASALLELSTCVEMENNYFATAEFILKSLSSEIYLAKKGENGFFILKHSVGNMPKKSEVDAPLSYADYYYLEALKRYIELKQKQ